MAAWISGHRGDTPVVFVEDILSAWRVHWAGFRAAAVLGTSFPSDVLVAALRGSTVAISWLDPDKAGREAHRKLRRAMGLHDQPLYRVQSERDPKLHSNDEIRNYIKEALDAR
jgi:DNA primase